MYPVLIDIKEFAVLIVGGGKIATRKAKNLVESGAVPTIIAPIITEELKALAENKQVVVIQRGFQKGDTSKFHFIFICTNDESINQLILQETTPEQLVNDTTNQARSNFFNMAVIKEQDFEIAITTQGKSPTQTKKLKEKIMNLLKSAT
ncbi:MULTISPECIES: precorrin-2 dehydrogenase/sirohydrochlorin ferrochelatase family protein [Enterococcus]|uniref:precorrin-2 dehydrogenase n=1 Tax=Candidatus Enterococcus murrayae TaxID=2815321 RepID=A0ABS3HCR7_9ENTE|nr:bifunctional precorrin-2 dehydrogenase/sirohydrochlorin ferrochelatase [Enterococcus sp. MJM16]MBO0451242.1 bifunctional precorrin-2 dehydrogenase/sirohydrochlorin ferrochelatase [Enterococcus sp. MJM16]